MYPDGLYSRWVEGLRWPENFPYSLGSLKMAQQINPENLPGSTTTMLPCFFRLSNEHSLESWQHHKPFIGWPNHFTQEKSNSYTL
jgi:hypothetical protein